VQQDDSFTGMGASIARGTGRKANNSNECRERDSDELEQQVPHYFFSGWKRRAMSQARARKERRWSGTSS
jgi:hypothetical protein